MDNNLQELEYANEFYDLLLVHAKRKISTNDGSNREFPIDTVIRFAIEELGEISSAITRDRFSLARDECLDLAHCALLIWISINKKLFDINLEYAKK